LIQYQPYDGQVFVSCPGGLLSESVIMRTTRLLMVLGLLIILIFVSTSSGTKQEYFHSESNGYSIATPDGWIQLPDSILRAHYRAIVSDKGVDIIDQFETAFLVKLPDNLSLEYPYLIIQVIKYSNLGIKRAPRKNELGHFLKAMTGLEIADVLKESLDNHLTDDSREQFSEIVGGKVYVNEQNMIYTYSLVVDMDIVGKVKGEVVGHIGRYAIVQLMFYSLDSDWSQFENERNLMFNSFQFDPAMAYNEAAEGPSRPGFWERRAMEALPVIVLLLIVAGIAVISGWVAGIARRHKHNERGNNPF